MGKIYLMTKWSIRIAAAIAVFWAIVGIRTESSPMVEAVHFGDWQLPFSDISRFWDALIGPIWSVVLVGIFTSTRVEERKYLFSFLAAGLVFCPVVGIIVGCGWGINIAFIVGIAIGLIVGIIAGAVCDPYVEGNRAYVSLPLVAGMGFGLALGLRFGLAVGLASSVIIFAVAVIPLIFLGAGKTFTKRPMASVKAHGA